MLSEKVIKNKAREFRQGGKDMRIAMLTNNYRPFVGGVPISVERQAEELIKLGHQVTVFAPMYGETQEEREAVLAADVSAPEQVDLFVITYKTAKSLDFTEIPAHSSNKLSAHLLSDHI